MSEKQGFASGKYKNGKRVITLANGEKVSPQELVNRKKGIDTSKSEVAASTESTGVEWAVVPREEYVKTEPVEEPQKPWYKRLLKF